MKEVNISSFKTKADKKSYLKEVLGSLKAGDVINKGDRFYNLFKTLTEIHPNSDTFEGICSHFEALMCVHNPKNINITYVNTVGERRVFSIYKSLDKTTSNDLKFKRAMRDVIKYYILDFKNKCFAEDADAKGYLICPISGLKFQRENCHIDHEYPLTFDSIVNTFIYNEKIDTSECSFRPMPGTEIEALIEELSHINHAFYYFHSKMCSLRPVYWRANLQGKRNKELIP